jgi:hypothetical protein
MARTVYAPQPRPDLTLTDEPSIKGKQGAVDWYRDVLGVAVSMNHVVTNTNSKSLPSYFIGGAVWYSTRDLYSHIMKTRRSE